VFILRHRVQAGPLGVRKRAARTYTPFFHAKNFKREKQSNKEHTQGNFKHLICADREIDL
jgi:hypothetical protein